MKLLDMLLAANVCALFLGNMGRFLTGVFIFPFLHLGLSILMLYVCLTILFQRHAFGNARANDSADMNAKLNFLGKEKRSLQGLALMMVLFTFIVLSVCLLNGVSLLLGVIYTATLLEPFIFLCTGLLIKFYAQQRALQGEKNVVESMLFYKALKYILIVSFVLGSIQAVLFGGFYDYVKGFFVGAGAGHHIFGGITSALVIFLAMRLLRVGIRSKQALPLVLIIAATMFMTMLTDTKQLLAMSLVLLIVFILWQVSTTRGNASAKLGSLLTVTVIFYGGWLYVGQFFTSQWDKFVLGMAWKANTLNTIWQYGRGDWFNTMFGFGPGQTVSKLSIMVGDYQGLFASLGLDIPSSYITTTIWENNQAYWVSNTITGSSLFSQFFSWAGILGDIGVLGVLVYAALIGVAIKATRSSPTATLLWFYFILIGFAFMWLEESPLPVSVALLAAIASYADDKLVGSKQEELPKARSLTEPAPVFATTVQLD